MCGIFGIVSHQDRVSHEMLARARESLAHRGPDDSGAIVVEAKVAGSGGGNFAGPCEIGLAHTRLSIIDLSPLGHQPMHDPVSGNWIVYNGEIYNFRELRNELEVAGVEFKSHSDTEVILAAYRVWGESFLTRLGGMFAFGLWDATRKRLLLARDPMGIKPLYYHESNKAFVFASEVRTLLGTGLVPRKVDPTGVLSYLAFGSVSEPWTIVDGVKAVPAGHIVVVENGSIASREYWNPLSASQTPEMEPGANGSASVARLPGLLRDAVLSHLVSDVPVGIFLSGGIDSSALVALLSENEIRANTFSLVFKEREYDEGQYSREVARRFRTEHHEIPVSAEDALAELPEALRAMDQPTIDGINTYLVSAKTRAAGVKVALTGLGADEMFAGYSNFRRVPKMESLARQLGRLPRSARRPLAASMAVFGGKRDRKRKLTELAAGDDTLVHPYFLARELFNSTERDALDSTPEYRASRQSLDGVLRDSVAASKSLDPVNRVSYFESIFYMRNTLLRDSDFMSMAHGLELRVPFLDRALVETCFGIPGKTKLNGSSPKSLLLASLGVELPHEIVNRPKRGFTLPFERWLRGEMRQTVESFLLKNELVHASLNPNAVRDVWNRFLTGTTSWSRPWSLFVLASWCERNL
ncbi:MAG TPA: asparagine synthase (glutamine-hydrolyzing) [Terriglobales bacterium]|nr:asparagine synthase (glutamine-hydrolyzing) [Terriglobales bacterium]